MNDTNFKVLLIDSLLVEFPAALPRNFRFRYLAALPRGNSFEDDEDDFILTSALLAEIKSVSYEVEWISKYADALAAICAGKHDVCLVDYRLGEGTGLELLRESVKNGCSMPLILLTGQGDAAIDCEAAEAGAANYLVKGEIETALLERSIRYAVKNARIHEKMRESENRFRSVIESASDAIVLTDGGRIFSWNKGAKSIFGYIETEIIGKPLATLFSSRFCDAENDIETMLAAGLLRLESRAQELAGIRIDGEEFPLEISFSSWQSAGQKFYCGIVRDVTTRKHLENQLSHQALHDPLTSLPNRVLFRNRLEHALARSDRRHIPLGILFLDLDNFKNVNDSLGHAAGDRLLVAVAERLSICLRVGDTAARLSGDEFAVLVEEAVNPGDALAIAERITEVLRAPFIIDGKEIIIGTSVGITITTTGKENPEELLRNADVAMYTAKSQGKGRYVVFENKMHAALVERIEIENDLRRAVEREELTLNYQPIIELQTGRITGMEALARWTHPTRGMISPMEFIPVAEETGLIIPLGRWVLETACEQARAWQNQYFGEEPFTITVNLSGRQFQQANLIETIKTALKKSGLPPACLVLEITESMMLQNTEATILKLHEIKDLGVRLAIDDFGTGYSALSYLERFPVDILKIDKSFVDKISSGGREGAAVARAIITMSDTLRMKTVAEGIEEIEQKEVLQGLGCEFGQGFHFARPLDTAAMNEFLSEKNYADFIAAAAIHQNQVAEMFI